MTPKSLVGGVHIKICEHALFWGGGVLILQGWQSSRTPGSKLCYFSLYKIVFWIQPSFIVHTLCTRCSASCEISRDEKISTFRQIKMKFNFCLL